MPEAPRLALDVIRSWPEGARAAASRILLTHGAPDETTDDTLAWRTIGPWTRVVVRASDPEQAVVEASVHVELTPSARPEVMAIEREFNVGFRDGGELVVRGPDLTTNLITLNVIYAMVHDELSLEQAHERRAQELAAARSGLASSEARGLHVSDDAPAGEPRVPRLPVDDED